MGDRIATGYDFQIIFMELQSHDRNQCELHSLVCLDR
jgi:hypothetical protein